MAQTTVDKWELLKMWVAKRHDYFEATYKQTNFSSDAADLGVYRAVYNVMRDLEEREALAKQQKSTTPMRPISGSGRKS